jgi:hypothetical protein
MKRHYYRKLQEWLAEGHRKPMMLRGVRRRRGAGGKSLLGVFDTKASTKQRLAPILVNIQSVVSLS